MSIVTRPRTQTPLRRILRVLAVAALMSGAGSADAQSTVPEQTAAVRLAIGFGIDTTDSPIRDLVRLWRRYLEDQPDRQRPSVYWMPEEIARYPDTDLLRTFVYQGFSNFTLLHVAPAPTEPSVYELRTLVARADSATGDVYPLAVYRVYAKRDGDQWRLSNALVHRTREWSRLTIGPLAYVSSPFAHVDTARARNTARFVDSLATAFGVPVPVISYIAAENLSAAYAALGLDFFPMATDTAGGRALVANRVVLVGGSTDVESNRHELTHVVLASLAQARTHRLLTEGLATWLGGSAGLSYRQLLPGLRAWLSTHPNATLQDILTDPPRRTGTLDVGYDVFAVICELAYAHGGVAAVRTLLNAGPAPADAVAGIARVLGRSPAQVDDAWRRRVRDGRD